MSLVKDPKDKTHKFNYLFSYLSFFFPFHFIISKKTYNLYL
jgi:hypothetical protein